MNNKRSQSDSSEKAESFGEIISLTAKESEQFVRTLFQPSKPNAVLKKAAKQYEKFFEKLSG